MKILLFTSVLSGGGAERVLCQLANGLSSNNDILLVAAYKTDSEYQINKKVKKLYVDSSVEKKNPALQIKRIRAIVKKEKPDICLSFLPQPNYKLILATLGLKTKVIISVRNDPKQEYSSVSNKVLSKILYPISDGIVFQTKQAKAYFSEKLRRKSAVIMNQVDEKFFSTHRKGKKYWIATGRLNSQKNYPMMLRTFSKLIAKYPDEVLRIYGQGDLNLELQHQIVELNLQKNVFIMGHTDDVAEALAYAKGFLLTSDYEGMPNGLLEALAMGIPCISTDCPCGGPREVIKNGINGFLIDVKDSEKLYDNMERLILDDELSKKISINAKKYNYKYKPENVLQNWKNFFDRVYNSQIK